MPVYKMLSKDRILEVEVGSPRFDICLDDLGYKKIVLTEVRETEYPNLMWLRIIAISLKYPFVRIAGGFMSQGGE